MARSTLRRNRVPAPATDRPSRLRLWLRRRRGMAKPAAFALLGVCALGALAYGVVSAGVADAAGC